ncbi:uncharacterized protein NDAI_0D01120 [Naumovozyma dairenensis CBS 421]|uniref:Uncharacterized protein n=1 Tax=Naumovozyma dairenensis (strain ATCC 10597 / BCRC 20456 / CBS 421 / NBRC 0211 / NRRL Y-12639) TaxID=1071378 RepID=G0W9G4_NAUDC|nr:hypothetical protein NDAI_0D01120 [Naumovozyma dairenensis CBS 421]CCD24425.1 hypothetical protein NDAI_0D01120 [Naumovozyma dairenensis CBS 421]
MAGLKIVSRKDLFDDSTMFSEHVEPELIAEEGHDDLEIVEIAPSTKSDSVEENNHDDNGQQQNDEDEFEFFPLFSMATEPTSRIDGVETSTTEYDEERGRSTNRLMKISLREPSPEIINQKRPKSHYFASYSKEEIDKFQLSAITYDSLLKEFEMGPNKGFEQFRGKVIDLKEYNDKIEAEDLREMRLKRRRPSQKQRLAKKLGAERLKERENRAKEIRKMIKKQFHKRGGKKNKKKAMNPLANAGLKPPVPKFRTE